MGRAFVFYDRRRAKKIKKFVQPCGKIVDVFMQKVNAKGGNYFVNRGRMVSEHKRKNSLSYAGEKDDKQGACRAIRFKDGSYICMASRQVPRKVDYRNISYCQSTFGHTRGTAAGE